MGNLIQTLLPAVILSLQGKIAKQVSPYPSSIITLIIAGNGELHTLFWTTNPHVLYNLRILILYNDRQYSTSQKKQSHKQSQLQNVSGIPDAHEILL